MKRRINATQEIRRATALWGDLDALTLHALKKLLHRHALSVALGDLLLLNGRWYITHSGLIRIAAANGCDGIRIEAVHEFCDFRESRFAFKAIVYTSRQGMGFVGYGDADRSNVSPLVRGAEMRVAETRAVNRALRKAYGIGICSVEELGSTVKPSPAVAESKKPVQPANGNYSAPKLRDRLFQLIRHHQLDPKLVKAFALDFCRTKSLRDASRQQIENFIGHLAERAEKDRASLVCQLNSYLPAEGSAA